LIDLGFFILNRIDDFTNLPPAPKKYFDIWNKHSDYSEPGGQFGSN